MEICVFLSVSIWKHNEYYFVYKIEIDWMYETHTYTQLLIDSSFQGAIRWVGEFPLLSKSHLHDKEERYPDCSAREVDTSLWTNLHQG